ncbi:MAG: trypsin-like peptidase domain-containing protein [Pirellulaceae bacterium]
MYPPDEPELTPGDEGLSPTSSPGEDMLPGPFPEDVQQISIKRLDPESSGVADQQHGSNPGYRLLRLLFVLSFLIVLSLALPWTVGRLWYSINRARLLAEYDVAGEMLNEESGEREGSDGASSQLQQVSQRIGPLVSQRVGPSVVHISTTDRGEEPSSRNLPRGFQDSNNFPSRGQGSGVVVDADGYILTNRHVVYESDTIQVKLSDGRSLEGTIVGVDTLTDLALLKVDARGLIPVEWGNSDKLKVGSFVWAVGSPFGLERSITFGILSAKHRSAQVGQYHQDFLQTDAAVNPGNSGGPLVDSSGKLVGINTAIMGETYQGISFAVPSNVAHDVYSRLRADGKVQRGWLGVALENVSEQMAARLGMESASGAVVAAFPRGDSPGREAGIQVGDVIMKFNETPIPDMGSLIRVVGQARPREQVELEIFRDGEQISLQMVIGERPAQQ